MDNIYCIWNNNDLINRQGHKASKVILVQTKWDNVKHLPRTSVKKFKPTQIDSAKAFAAERRDIIARLDWEKIKP